MLESVATKYCQHDSTQNITPFDWQIGQVEYAALKFHTQCFLEIKRRESNTPLHSYFGPHLMVKAATVLKIQISEMFTYHFTTHWTYDPSTYYYLIVI